jgi:prepilin-type N-terminal cleavage/methylation domain-containing protein
VTLMNCRPPQSEFRTPGGRFQQRLRRSGFTLVELLVVIIIITILSAMTLGGLASARKSSRAQTTSLIIRALNDAIMSRYEGYEDVALVLPGPTAAAGLVALRKQMREEMPDAWANVADSASLATTAAGKSYSRYKQQCNSAASTVSIKYQSAECLYMIVAASGFFPEFMENTRPERVGDVDGDGAKEFLDGWGNPIAFRRWAPGFSSPYSPIQTGDKSSQRDPINYYDDNTNTWLDDTAFALYPLIYSSGVDGDYGLVPSDDDWAGWPDANLSATSPNTPCLFQPTGKLVGAPDATNAYRDNITNHAILAQ